MSPSRADVVERALQSLGVDELRPEVEKLAFHRVPASVSESALGSWAKDLERTIRRLRDVPPPW